MNSETPFEGNVPDDGDEPAYEWLDEWLCEYVDGTMDPSLEAVFEQYVEANPDLKAHVKRLQKTRELLGNFGPPDASPASVETDVCRHVETDGASSGPSSEATHDRTTTALSLVSVAAVALVVGFLVGANVVNPSLKSSHFKTPGATKARSLPAVQPSQAPLVDPFDGPRSQSVGAFSPSDSARRQSPLTTIGVP